MQFSALLGNEVKIERMENISHPGRLIWAQVREVGGVFLLENEEV